MPRHTALSSLNNIWVLQLKCGNAVRNNCRASTLLMREKAPLLPGINHLAPMSVRHTEGKSRFRYPMINITRQRFSRD